jgi:DNA-binding HxlR family transcriptional regulator
MVSRVVRSGDSRPGGDIVPEPTSPPQDPHGPRARISELLAEERVKGIVRVLSGGPLQPSELEQRLGIPRSTLHARLRALAEVGLLRHDERSSFPHIVEYGLTDPGRVVSARRILTDRRQGRELAPDRALRGEELADVLRLLAPVSRAPAGVEGTCTLRKRQHFKRTLELWIVARAGRLELCEQGPPPSEPAASITASSSEWDDALLIGGDHELRVSGDGALAEAVLGALCAALR